MALVQIFLWYLSATEKGLLELVGWMANQNWSPHWSTLEEPQNGSLYLKKHFSTIISHPYLQVYLFMKL